MKNLITNLIVILLSAFMTNAFAQTEKPNRISELLNQKSDKIIDITIFEENGLPVETLQNQSLRIAINKEVAQASIYSLNSSSILNIEREEIGALKFSLPQSIYGTFSFELFEANIFAPDYKFKVASNPNQALEHSPIKHYWGIVNSDKQSIASLSIMDGEIAMFFYIDGKTYNLGKLGEFDNQLYILTEESDGLLPNNTGCEVEDYEEELMVGNPNTNVLNNQQASSDNCIRMYFEVDYDAYLARGSSENVLNYVQGLMSQVAILFANENINFVVQEILVWDIEDPYNGTNSYQNLILFKDHLNGNFNGDLAQLLGYNNGYGGVAYVNTLCSSTSNLSYASIRPTYNIVPLYSSSVMVVTHEIGHNLGSSHTHSCVWNGNNTAIDRCGPSRGYGASSCNDDAPIPYDTGGTIMSYCHIVSGVGVNFNLGFGPQPGDLMRANIATANCLTACDTGPEESLDASIVNIVQPMGAICEASVTPSITVANQGQVEITTINGEFQLNDESIQPFSWSGNLQAGQTAVIEMTPLSINSGNNQITFELLSINGTEDDIITNNVASTNFVVQDQIQYFRDFDNDGYGDSSQSIWSCSIPDGYVIDDTDCDDFDNQIFPSAPCNDGDDCTINDFIDEDCNCIGTFVDEDEDNVCDFYDECPGFDDNIDNNNNGTPDGCESSTSTVLHEGYFETGWDGWIDGGGDATRYISSVYSYENTFSIRLRDDSGESSSMRLENLDLSNYDQVTVDFYFYSYSMEYSEDFFVYLNVNNNWVEIANFASGIDFDDFGFHHVTISLLNQDYSFLTDNGFKIQCDASTNGDQIFVDQVIITGSTGVSSASSVSIESIQSLATGVNSFNHNVPLWMEDENASDDDDKLEIGSSIDFVVYPNPATDFINVDIPNYTIGDIKYQITNTFGQIVDEGMISKNKNSINLNRLPKGAYVLTLQSNQSIDSKVFTVY